MLHDVGKIGIPDAVLLKPAKLDAAEFAVMRRHSELGRDIIAGAGLEEIASWVLHLHERFDGRGYPDGLAGEEIPLESRILHCADALEAMTSSRIYRPGMPVERALEEIETRRRQPVRPGRRRHAGPAGPGGRSHRPYDRPITSSMISSVPAPMRLSRRSRQTRSIPYSFM